MRGKFPTAPGIVAAMRVATLALALALAAMSSSCDDQSKALEQAKVEYAEGKLDVALASLKGVRSGAPDSPEAAEAQKLATTWLLADADKQSDWEQRRGRLESALEWSPESGPAQARLCLVLVETKKLAEAEKCLSEGLAGKTDVPDDVVSEAKSQLAAHKKTVKELADKTYEAGSLRRRGETFCADTESYATEMESRLKELEALANERVPAAQKAAKLFDRVDAYEQIGKDASKLAGPIKSVAIEIDSHAKKPGEEEAHKALGEAFWEVYDLAAGLGEGLKRPAIENDESYDAHAKATLDAWTKKLKASGESARKASASARASCKAK